MNFSYFLFFCTLLVAHSIRAQILDSLYETPQVNRGNFLRWCVVNFNELKKCEEYKVKAEESIQIEVIDSRNEYMKLECIQAKDYFDCMELISQNQADLVHLETGLAQYAIHWHMLTPIAIEEYGPTNDPESKYFYSVGVVHKGSLINSLDDIKGKKSCHAGAGYAGSWSLPISYLIENKFMDIVDCTVQMKTITNYFGKMCAVGSLSKAYNPFGLNPISVCDICNGTEFNHFCNYEDSYSGYYGALQCMLIGRKVGLDIYEKGDIAWLNHFHLDLENINDNNNSSGWISPVEQVLRERIGTLELLCKDGTKAPLTNFKQCNWGRVPANVFMTHSDRSSGVQNLYRRFLELTVEKFGLNSESTTFSAFDCSRFGYNNRRDCMFSDHTKGLYNLYSLDEYNNLFKNQDTGNVVDILEHVAYLNYCPSLPVRLCVSNDAEFQKCTRMRQSFKEFKLKPEIDCLQMPTLRKCMKMVQVGDADLVNLDAGDIYIAGSLYDLVPIVASDYGDSEMPPSAHVVAVAQKNDPITTLYNLRERRTCHPYMGSAAGWYIPMLILIGSKVMPFEHCNIAGSLDSYVNYACVPGSMDEDYVKSGFNQPVTLCEGCAANSFKRCAMNTSELYYGHSGAMRCMSENSGDVAFVKHFTPRENVDGNNRAEWARNRRSEDYQLICANGHRASIDDWQSCNLGRIPANALVTSAFKDQKQREVYWQLLNHAQLYFSSDSNPQFQMFESEAEEKDLIFEDATSRLLKIPEHLQNYKAYLNHWDFLKIVEQINKFDCVHSGTSDLPHVSFSLVVFNAMLLSAISGG